MNRYTAIGNLTKDPVCRDAGNNKVCNFSIAINEYYYTNNEKKQSTFYLDIECWSKQAENCTKFLSKGSKVAIDGKLKSNSWEKNGQKFSRTICIAEKVHFLGSDEPTTKKDNNKNAKQIEEKLENLEEGYDDIDDIPF
jgi:single-strand DNA-binding protein